LLLAAGLRIVASAVRGPEVLTFPSAEVAIGFWRQVQLVQLMLRGLPTRRRAELERAFEDRVGGLWDDARPEERRFEGWVYQVVAERR
jgi:hypothetical protein